jgi:hypothetical protein
VLKETEYNAMSENETSKASELRPIRNMLRQMYRMAEHASMTGALSAGAPDAVEKYNLLIAHLERLGLVAGPLFPPLPEDASFDRVGVASKLLDGYLEGHLEEEENGRQRGFSGGPNIVIGNLPDLKELEKLKDLGKTIREHLPEWLRQGAEEKKATAASEEDKVKAPPTPPTAAPSQPMPSVPTGEPVPFGETR